MFGTGYWESAKTSFWLVIRNKNRLGATVSVASVVPTVGKVAAASMTTAVFYFIQVWGFPDQGISMTCSCLVCALTSWVVSSQFLAPFVQAPTTLLQCFMIDGEFFASNSAGRFAEKEMHAWVDTYGGEYPTFTDQVM
mmetsp:Transcript_43606/g.88169  ORF Transcript_43606/g.88169 Transcript_43606/m.88169 type:complete len:138 (+) Transcript_43606:35-448(+)